MESIKHTVKQLASQGNNSVFVSVLPLILLVWNFTTAKNGRDERQ
jgi:hypothetical protein